MARSDTEDLAVFESYRALLVALAYRMLGDLGRAEDMVQEAWLRWQGRREDADSPRAYLVTIVTRLCLNELDSAKARHEESRSDRLPEPVDLDEGGIGRLESLDQVSMAFLVVLQRLTPAERAVLLLHDVFDFAHDEIATLVGKSEAACRKLLERARQNVATEKRLFSTSQDAHRRLLGAFVQATYAGDVGALVAMLARRRRAGHRWGPRRPERRRYSQPPRAAPRRRPDCNVRRRGDQARVGRPGSRGARAQRPAGDGPLSRGRAVRGDPARRRGRAHSPGLLSRRRRTSPLPRTAALSGRMVVVTGATGNVGRELVNLLLAQRPLRARSEA